MDTAAPFAAALICFKRSRGLVVYTRLTVTVQAPYFEKLLYVKNLATLRPIRFQEAYGTCDGRLLFFTSLTIDGQNWDILTIKRIVLSLASEPRLDCSFDYS